jgi:O-antigen/teichoic acid export membrane protein
MVTMSGNTWANTVNSVVTFVSTLTLSIWLIPQLNFVGAAIAAAAGTIIVNLIRLGEAYWLLRLLPYNRSFVKPIIAGLASTLAIFTLASWVPIRTNWLGALLGACVLLALYASVILLLGLSEEDRLILTRLRARLWRRS